MKTGILCRIVLQSCIPRIQETMTTIATADNTKSPGQANELILHPSYRMRLESLQQQLTELEADLLKEALKIQRFINIVQSIAFVAQQRLRGILDNTASALTALSENLSQLKKKKGLSKSNKAFIAELFRQIRIAQDDLPGMRDLADFSATFMTAGTGDSSEESWSGSHEYENSCDEDFEESSNSNPTGKDLRSLYLSLSKRFHPDLARSEEERVQFTEVMGEINQLNDAKNLGGMLKFAESLKVTTAGVSGESINIECERLVESIFFAKLNLKDAKKAYRALRKDVPDAKAVDAVLKGKKTVENIVVTETSSAEESLEIFSFANQLAQDCIAGVIDFGSFKDQLEERIDVLNGEDMLDDDFSDLDLLEAFMQEFLNEQLASTNSNNKRKQKSPREKGSTRKR
jgi:hypothetical protein